MTIRLLKTISIILVLLSFFSCKREEEGLGQEIVTLNVSLGGEEYDEQEANFGGKSEANGMRSASKSNISTANNVPAMQVQEIPLEDGFYISAEVTPTQGVYRPTPAKSSSVENKAAIVVNPIRRAIAFRLVAFNSSGAFFRDKVYNIAANGTVSPADGVAMQLPNGQYTFIAYSYNTGTAPTENLSGVTASSFTIQNAPVANGFMLFNSGPVNISPQASMNLSVVLRHLTSPMQVLIDATATNGYLITSIGATTLGSTRGTATVNLSSGTINSYAGTTATGTFTFASSTGAAQRASNMVYLANTATTTATLTIASLVVGPLNQTTPLTLNNISITPGIAYTVRLRLNPRDQFVTAATIGQDAVLINGRYWMRRNVGVATTVNPDVPDATNGFRDHIGGYYQWGRNTSRATGSTVANQTGAHWNTREASTTTWNSGPETAPVKTANDPCPQGWRVPTRNEWNLLLANTTQEDDDNIEGSWTAGNTNYSTAKVFRSLRDRDVVLTFPSGGAFTPTTVNNAVVGVLQSRGAAGAYWTSVSDPANTATNALRVVTNETSALMGQGNNNKNFAINIRCTRDVQ